MLCAHATEVLSVLESGTQAPYTSREYSLNSGTNENFEAEANSTAHVNPEKENFLPPYGHRLTERGVTRYSFSFLSTRKMFFTLRIRY